MLHCSLSLFCRLYYSIFCLSFLYRHRLFVWSLVGDAVSYTYVSNLMLYYSKVFIVFCLRIFLCMLLLLNIFFIFWLLNLSFFYVLFCLLCCLLFVVRNCWLLLVLLRLSLFASLFCLYGYAGPKWVVFSADIFCQWCYETLGIIVSVCGFWFPVLCWNAFYCFRICIFSLEGESCRL